MTTREENHNRLHFRQLCCLGLGGETIMPDILKTLHGIIEHHSSIFVFFDDTGQPCNLYSDIFIPDIINLYFTEYENLISPYAPDLPAIARHGKPAGNYRHMPKAFYGTDMYNLICRPCNQHFLLDGTVKENGKPQGIVVLYREKAHTRFSQKHEQTLVSLLPTWRTD